jgi:hypothetical protein
MRKTGLFLLYTAGILTFLGGLGDQFIMNYLDVHLDFLGNPEPSDLLSRSERLSMLLLHAAGGGFMSTGLAMLALAHFGIRRDQNWAKWTYLIIALIAQGINGYAMFSAGSLYGYAIVVLLIALLGLLLVR